MPRSRRLQEALDRLERHRVELERDIVAEMEALWFRPAATRTDDAATTTGSGSFFEVSWD